jgi:lipoprotein-releasing system permease protein
MLFLAMKQLLSKKKQTFLILMGISFGTMLFVSISGIQLGFRAYIINALLNNTAHVIIKGPEKIIQKNVIQDVFFKQGQVVNWFIPPSGKRDESKLENYPGWSKRLREDVEVYDFSPRLVVNAMIKKGSLSSNVTLFGSHPIKQLKISKIKNYMIEGHFEDLAGAGNKIVIGAGVAKDLGVKLGHFVDVYTGSNEATPFKVVGMSKFGDDRTDKTIAFAHLTDTQKLNRTPGRVTEVAVALHDMSKSEELAKKWSLYTNDKVQDWKNANQMFMQMIKMQDIVRYFITISILIVAAFGVYNVLTIMINQKQKEIAILRSIGYPPKKILMIILYQGFFLGVSGGLVGLILGFLVVFITASIDLGFELGGSNHMMVSYDLSIYVIAMISAIIASIIASLIPAYAASKMTPIDIIRGHS